MADDTGYYNYLFCGFWILNQMMVLSEDYFVALFMVSTIVVFTLIYIFPLLANFEKYN